MQTQMQIQQTKHNSIFEWVEDLKKRDCSYVCWENGIKVMINQDWNSSSGCILICSEDVPFFPPFYLPLLNLKQKITFEEIYYPYKESDDDDTPWVSCFLEHQTKDFTLRINLCCEALRQMNDNIVEYEISSIVVNDVKIDIFYCSTFL